MNKRNTALTVMLVLWVLVGNAWGVVQYGVTDLRTLTGPTTWAYGINNSGQVAGEDNNYIFRTAPNQAINPATDNLGQFGGPFVYYGGGINDRGQVVGFVPNNAVGGCHAFRSAANAPGTPPANDLGSFGGRYTYAFGVNNNGQVVGKSYSPAMNHSHAFRTAPNQSITVADDLGTFGGNTWSLSSAAYGINSSGQVVGFSGSSDFGHAFRTAPNQPITAADDLGTLGGRYSCGLGINDIGQVVGWADTGGGDRHAFLYSGGAMVDLGTVSGLQHSQANGINGLGMVGGCASNDINLFDGLAFLYSGSGPMQDLNGLIPPGSGWTLLSASGINDSGQICGYGVNPTGQTHAFRLDPVPEPSTFALLGVGAIGLLGYAWRRRKRADRCALSYLLSPGSSGSASGGNRCGQDARAPGAASGPAQE